MKRLSLLVAAAMLAACPKTQVREVIPRLPADGTANIAQPSDTAAPPKARDPWSGRTDLIQPPPAKAPQAVTLPTVERFTLPNGLDVVIVKSDRLPTVTMQLAIRAGRAEEPLARLGIAELTANLLPKGTKKRNALAIARAIDFVGGSITSDAGYEATWLTCASLAKDAKTCLELMPEMVATPSFAPEEIDKAKAAVLTDISRRLDDTATLATVHVQNLLWGDEHVRGWVTSAPGIQRLTRADLQAFHKTWFVPGNAQLAVAGNVDVAKLKKDLARAFGGWKAAPVPARPRYPDPQPRAKVRLVDKPGLTQTQIRVGQFGLRHDDARFFPTLVWNYALGGGAFSSRLMTVVRSEGGKTYGASTNFDRNLERGSLIATTFTRTDETVATLGLVLEELRKMRDAGPTADETEAAIANLAGGYALRLAGADDIAAALVTADLHGLSQAYVTDFPLLVARVTPEEAAGAARELLHPESAAIVLVGDGDKIAPQLEAAKIPFERVAWNAPIGAAPGQPADRKVDPGRVAAAQKVLDAAIAAKGGDKLLAVKALRLEASGTLTAGDQKLDVVFRRVLVLPDRMRMDIELQKQFKVTIAVSGDRGWTSNPQGIGDLPASQLPALTQQRWVDPDFVVLRGKDKDTTAELVGTEKVDGAVCDVVHISMRNGLEALLFIDQQTKLLRQTRYPNGGGETRESYGDYRDVNGLKIPYKRTAVSPGETTDLTVTSVELDPQIDAAIFAKPKS